MAGLRPCSITGRVPVRASAGGYVRENTRNCCILCGSIGLRAGASSFSHDEFIGSFGRAFHDESDQRREHIQRGESRVWPADRDADRGRSEVHERARDVANERLFAQP